ncbi:MAG TPA: aromatic ring-hydroxylating dioxygenase subunit alpha [Steroidobacteraceae bacterium]|jgi:Rieske 2Fe-2S family protein|nr:aromatic ring-hydroxylating dioxygenase subunit alpha [Steroidobacteraceae bacterium]
MNARRTAIRRDAGYAGLTEPVATLPASYYFDPQHYELELQRIWYRNWLYACRGSELGAARSFRTLQVGNQSVLIVRGEDGVARAFHNTCRHRGAALCRTNQGRFPPAGIVCPYHSWRYSLQGELLQTSSVQPGDGFETGDHPLYSLPLTEWNGFIFIALSSNPPPFAASFDLPLNRLDDWQLGTLALGHSLRKTIECNWKVFWENYNECLHCPGVHPRLAQLVPIFGRALLERRDDPRWQDHAQDDDPRYGGGLRRGAESWSMDGKPVGVPFPGVSEEDRKLGHIYLTSVPSVFIVAHVDYVRVVRLLPLGPERTEMSIEFLFLPETLADRARDIQGAVEFTDIVMSEDADVCELNQRGLHALAHDHGVLMPEEYAIRQFQDWVRAELARS